MGEGDVFLGNGGEGGRNFERVLKNFWRVHIAQIKQPKNNKKNIYEDCFVYDDSRFTGTMSIMT